MLDTASDNTCMTFSLRDFLIGLLCIVWMMLGSFLIGSYGAMHTDHGLTWTYDGKLHTVRIIGKGDRP